jgi:hypothetical protein
MAHRNAQQAQHAPSARGTRSTTRSTISTPHPALTSRSVTAFRSVLSEGAVIRFPKPLVASRVPRAYPAHESHATCLDRSEGRRAARRWSRLATETPGWAAGAGASFRLAGRSGRSFSPWRAASRQPLPVRQLRHPSAADQPGQHHHCDRSEHHPQCGAQRRCRVLIERWRGARSVAIAGRVRRKDPARD